MKGPLPMIGRIVGGALGGRQGKGHSHDPLASMVIGTVTMVVARKLLPARVAALGAAVAAGYVTRKLAQRAERRAKSPTPPPANP